MKLYTEEQVKEAMFLYRAPIRPLVEQVLDQLTPIELPSDEEIEKESKPKITPNSRGGFDFASKHIGWEDGAKWLKEQILNQNK